MTTYSQNQMLTENCCYMNVLSPLTGKPDVTLVDTLPSGRIIDLYQSEFKVNVAEYFAGVPKVEIYQCNQTKYRFYYPFSLVGNDEFYRRLSSGNEHYYPGWKWENQIALDYIATDAHVLDVGCGDGTFLYELAARKQVKAEGLEFNQHAIGNARKKGVSVHNQTIQEFAAQHEGQFDVVTCFQVLEHIPEVHSFLAAQIQALKKNGLLIIGVPYCNPYIYKSDKYDTLNLPPHHMGLWDEKPFQNLEQLFAVKLEKCHITKVFSMAYYLSIQLGLKQKFLKLYWGPKYTKLACQAVNKLLAPLRHFFRGRDIVVVLRKL